MPCLLDSPRLSFTTSGRAAIALALQALGVGSGDRVLVPTYHCPTMVAPAVHVGARPVFYPLRSSGADLAFLEALDLTGVRAILATHYFGLPQPMAELRRFCDRKGIALIEDCAHALFGVVRRARHRDLGRLCDREPDQVLLGAGGRLPDRQPAADPRSPSLLAGRSRTRSNRWSTSSSSAFAIAACPASTMRSDSCSRCGAGPAAPAPWGSSPWTSIWRRARTPSRSSTAITPTPGSRRRAGSSCKRSADRASWSVAVTTTVRSPEGSPGSRACECHGPRCPTPPCPMSSRSGWTSRTRRTTR